MTKQITSPCPRLRIWLGAIGDDLAWRVPAGTYLHKPTVALFLSGSLFACALGQMFPATPALGMLALLSVILVQPVLEELIFRGFLLTRLLRHTHTRTGRCVAITLQALAFSLLHIVHHPAVWATLIVVPGMLFGWLRVRHDSVLPAMAAHSAFNGAYWLPGLFW